MPPNRQARNPTPDRPPTEGQAKLRLVAAATRLFGEHGIDAVALKDIVVAAGHKNQSAIQYHFGDKDGLIAAALEDRFRAIDARRVEILRAAEKLSGSDRRASVMRATVEPIVAEAESHRAGPQYIRFVVQALQRPDFDAATIITGSKLPGFQALNAAIARERKQMLSGAELEQRIRLSAKLTMTGVADWVAHGFGPLSRMGIVALLARANEALLL